MIIGLHETDKIFKAGSFSTPFHGIRVRFYTTGFYKIFRFPVCELHNIVYAVEDVLGNDIKSVLEKIEDAKDNYERKEILDKYFLYKLNKSFCKSLKTELCAEAINTIEHYSGNIRMPALAKQLNNSERHLERDFKTIVGLTPKELCETIRLQHVIRSLAISETIDWHELIFTNGYFDQAHLINDFKKASSVTPEWFIKNKNKKFLITNSLLIFLTNDLIREAADLASEACHSFI
jgi:AraC-like DNA-binding protein